MQQQLIIGTLLHGGTYKIEKILGQGSFGITYLAEHTNLGKKVAIKEFFMKELNSRGEDGSITGMSDSSLSQNYCQKFKKEAINLSRLDHPNIVRVTDSFSENGTFYYVMDFIEGQNLNDYIKSHYIDEAEAVSIIKSVADALIYMHEEKHMLHLDLKPGNVMRRNDGHIFLIDFGLSKHYSTDGQPETSTTIGLGTAGYAPIEQSNQAKNGEFRPTIDVYAIGATFYKLLTRGTPPPASDLVSDDELLENKLREKGLSDNLIKVVTEAMCPNVRKRTQTIREFKGNLGCIKSETQATINVTSDDTIAGTDKEETIVTSAEDFKKTGNVSKSPVFTEDAAENTENKATNEDDISLNHSIFNFKGRVGRVVVVFSIFVIGLFIFVCEEIARSINVQDENGVLSTMWLIMFMTLWVLYFYVVLAVGAKRCHDLGHSGWFQMIPYYVFVMLFGAGDRDGNEYGERGDGISKKSLKLLGKIVGGIFGISLFFIFIANRGNSGVIDDMYDYQYDATADTVAVDTVECYYDPAYDTTAVD